MKRFPSKELLVLIANAPLGAGVVNVGEGEGMHAPLVAQEPLSHVARMADLSLYHRLELGRVVGAPTTYSLFFLIYFGISNIV